MSQQTIARAIPANLAEYLEADDEARRLAESIDWTRPPRHIAVIMDGNGRWARRRSLPRIEGHRSGIAAVRETVETSTRAGIEALTLFAFSKQNWRRPQHEVDGLMRLLRRWLAREIDRIHEQGIRFQILGRAQDLPDAVRADLDDAVQRTATNEGLRFNIALSYGGRTEIVDAARALATRVRDGLLAPEDIDEATFAANLYTAGIPDPDLLIRTSGEVRVSNFLLYQIAYAEIWVTDTLWPDFRRADLLRAIVEFQRRERRFGGIEARRDPAP